MVKGKGPTFPEPLLSPEDARARLNYAPDDLSELEYVFKAITLTRHRIEGRTPRPVLPGA